MCEKKAKQQNIRKDLEIHCIAEPSTKRWSSEGPLVITS